MKISHKVLKEYTSNLDEAEKIKSLLTMHVAEVESIEYEGSNLEKVFISYIKSVQKHPDSEKLNLCTVELNGNEYQIVCGANNVIAGIKVPLAIIGADLGNNFIIKKSKIRGEISEGMICSEDELGLKEERQEGIMILNKDAPLGVSMKEYLGYNNSIIDIDNKAINHRPDLFSHIGIIRELYAISGKKFSFDYETSDFSELTDLGIINQITDEVKRYIGIRIDNVTNIETPDYIKDLLKTEQIESKGLLVDITNYSLYLYGQPTHCFDAEKIKGTIIIRKAKTGEDFKGLNGKKYQLNNQDIVIADSEKVLALGGIIGGESSSVDNSTKNIIIEGAHFNQATVRKTGKRHGLRTDALNIFEKDLQPDMANIGVNLIISELKKAIPSLKLISISDIYPEKQKQVFIDFDLAFINKLIGKSYTRENSLNILNNLGVIENNNVLSIPFWRKDLNFKADIAEEIARIDGYNKIDSTINEINSGAVLQDKMYNLKNDSRHFFVNKGFYDMYNYSFVGKELMEKVGANTDNLIPLKNYLSEDATHMKDSHIPNLLKSIEKNIKQFKNLKLFEIEKTYKRQYNQVSEQYCISAVVTSEEKIPYYELQKIVNDYLSFIGIKKHYYEKSSELPKFAHSGRTGSLIVRGKEVGIIGEIHPMLLTNFKISKRVAFFEIDLQKLCDAAYGITKATTISEYQENNFDINFLIDKKIKGSAIKNAIEKTNPKIINKVELFDIYEDEDKLPGKRSISFKVYIQSLEGTLDDKVKNELILEIVKKVEAKGGNLR